MPARPSGVYDLRIDGKLEHQESAAGGKVLRINMATGSAVTEPLWTWSTGRQFRSGSKPLI